MIETAAVGFLIVFILFGKCIKDRARANKKIFTLELEVRDLKYAIERLKNK